MERLYVGLRVLGQRDRVRNGVIQAIQSLRAGLRIPVIKLERPHSRRGGMREFYLFLGTDEEQDSDLRSLAGEVFHRAHLHGQPFWGIREQELRSSFVGEVDVTVVGGLRDIYEPRWQQVAEALALAEPLPAPDARVEESVPFDRFLSWLSARGEGTWPAFVQAAQALGIDTGNPTHLRRRLSLLGHIEWGAGRRRWCIAAPTLIRSAAEPGCWFLSGARTDRWLERLGRRTPLRLVPQRGAPTRVETSGLEEAGASLSLTGGGEVYLDAGGAQQRAERLPSSLAEYKACLDEVPRLIPALLRFQYWDGRAFIDPPERVYEEDVGVYHGRPGMYRITRDK